jgi:hypothetical protein
MYGIIMMKSLHSINSKIKLNICKTKKGKRNANYYLKKGKNVPIN